MTKSLRLMKRFVIIPKIGSSKDIRSSAPPSNIQTDKTDYRQHHHQHQHQHHNQHLSSQDEQKPKSRHATERRLRCSGAQVLTELRLRCKSTAAKRKLCSFYISDNANYDIINWDGLSPFNPIKLRLQYVYPHARHISTLFLHLRTRVRSFGK